MARIEPRDGTLLVERRPNQVDELAIGFSTLLDAAHSVQMSASHQQHVKDVVADILEVSDRSGDESQ